MRKLIDSLEPLWSEYKRRLELIGSNEYTIKNARQDVCQLDHFMVKNGYRDYIAAIGEEFLVYVKNDAKKSKWLHRYKRIVAHINSCASGSFWSEDFYLYSYTIKNKELADLYQRLCEDLDCRDFCSNSNNLRDYAFRCFKHLDLFMYEYKIAEYSPDVGTSFVKCMAEVSHKGKSCFDQTYIYTIRRLNGLLSNSLVHCRIATDYSIKHEEIRTGLDSLIRVLSDNSYSTRSINVVIRIIKHLDLYMLNQGITSYSEQVGIDFSNWFNKHLQTTDRHDGYQRYILAHFNDIMNGKDYCCCHRNLNSPIPKAYEASFELFLSDCRENSNKESTIKYKSDNCRLWFDILIEIGCSCPQKIKVETIGKSCALINSSAWRVIRGYLRSCFAHGFTDMDYSFFVPHKRRKTIFPTYYSKEERLKLEATPDRTTSIGKRDYAIILIINRLGLRSSDVTHMTFSNIISEDGSISFDQYKTGNPQQLPLLKVIEEAVRDYIENGRPKSECDEIFIRTKAPFGALSSPAIHGIITRNLTKAEVDIGNRKHGGHALRSSLLTSMINNGMTYEEARYVLGHKDDKSIQHYASLDIAHLRLCASDIPFPDGGFKKLLNSRK